MSKKVTNKPEILAPAGSMESLTAALRCGADAVYGGGTQYSARQSAENFTLPQLQEAIQLCHLYGAKFYLTLNTLIWDREWQDCTSFLDQAVDMGIDGVLVQDFGLLDWMRQRYPDVPVHASTQMTIHTPLGARWASQKGMTRIVAARELSREEVAVLCQEPIEIEQFVHGALCMSVSGQCRFSAICGGRSANRGRCAQICRLPFTSSGDARACALSLKDQCLVPYACQMAEDGVASLKIEGRCKRPEYVAAAVTATRDALDGKTPDLHTLQAVFSRSGFTDGYYTGKRQEMFGVRRKEDVTAAEHVLPKVRALYREPKACVPVDMEMHMTAGEPVTLSLRDHEGHAVTVTGPVVEVARNKPATPAYVRPALSKTGGTFFQVETMDLHCDGVGTLPISALNHLRRDGLDALKEARIVANTPRYVKHEVSPLHATVQKPAQQMYRVRVAQWSASVSALLAEPQVEAVILPAFSNLMAVPIQNRASVILDLPVFCADEARLTQTLQQAKDAGYTRLCCENVAHILLGQTLGFTLYGGLGLSVTNTHAAVFLQKEGLRDLLVSPECTARQIRDIGGLPTGVYAYGKMPLMTYRVCPIQAERGCKGCPHALTDRTGRTFPVFCDRAAGVTTLYNSMTTYLADKQDDFPYVSYFLLDSTLSNTPQTIVRAFQEKKTPVDAFTRGLYYRGVE